MPPIPTSEIGWHSSGCAVVRKQGDNVVHQSEPRGDFSRGRQQRNDARHVRIYSERLRMPNPRIGGFLARQISNVENLTQGSFSDPTQIRPGFVSPANEGDQLPRQNREAHRCADHHAQLEYDPKSPEDTCSTLTAERPERLCRSQRYPQIMQISADSQKVDWRLETYLKNLCESAKSVDQTTPPAETAFAQAAKTFIDSITKHTK
jgi:hypothetical protein